jgi:hypothetical protein
MATTFMEFKVTYILHDGDTVRTVVSHLILLERDATAAYVRILHRLVDATSRETIGHFLENRQRRLAELTRMSFALRSGAPGEAVARHYLPTGRIALDSLESDGAILNAMRVGEDETVAAYERASTHPQASLKSRTMFERSLRDALQHRAWTEDAAQAHQAA